MKEYLMEQENLGQWTKVTTKGEQFTMLMQMLLSHQECSSITQLGNVEGMYITLRLSKSKSNI